MICLLLLTLSSAWWSVIISTIAIILTIIGMFWKLNLAGKRRFNDAMRNKADVIVVEQIKKQIHLKKDTEVVNQQLVSVQLLIAEIRTESDLKYSHIQEKIEEIHTQSENSDNAIFKLLKEMRGDIAKISDKLYHLKK